MPADIQITVEAGIIRVVYRGEARFDVTTAMLRDVVRVAAENQSKLVLIDASGMESRHYHTNAILQANQAPALGIDRAFRIAFLAPENYEMVRYVEDVVVNRGYQAKAFTNEPAAIAWLLGEP